MKALKSVRRRFAHMQRASITLTPLIYRRGINIVDREGFKTFSSYIEYLIRTVAERRKPAAT